MTAIVPLSIKTKKQLKAHLAAGEQLILQDPSPWGTRFIHLNAQLDGGKRIAHIINGHEMEVGYSVCCTNHPKRSWFAQISIKPGGSLKVT